MYKTMRKRTTEMIPTSLVFAPHADDEVLGMGGTIAKLVEQGQKVVLVVVTGHGSDPHPIWPRKHWEAIELECERSCQILGISETVRGNFPAVALEQLPVWKINYFIKEQIEKYAPQKIFCPFSYDLHKDHNVVSYAVTVGCRPYLMKETNLTQILQYETLSETHLAPPYSTPGFQPNHFVDISKTIEKKIAALGQYKSQLQAPNNPRTIEAIEALAVLRGAHIGTAAAEAFVSVLNMER